MFLILYIKDHNHGSWLAYEQSVIKFGLDFDIARGEDSSLKYLDKFFKKFKLNWRQLRGLALIVGDASLTQVKVFSTMINIIAWQYQLPIAADFYSTIELNKILEKISAKLNKHHPRGDRPVGEKKFKQIAVKYKQKADITINHRHPSYKIIK